jgi:hypothetical protein
MSVKWLEGRGWEWMPQKGDFAKKSRPDYWLSRDHCTGVKYCKKTGRKKKPQPEKVPTLSGTNWKMKDLGASMQPGSKAEKLAVKRGAQAPDEAALAAELEGKSKAEQCKILKSKGFKGEC